MNIRFNNVIIDSFMSFKYEELDLNKLGTVLIRGKNEFEPLSSSNGSGKSAISESIMWCLTGATTRGSSEVSNQLLNQGTCVVLDFNIDDNHYKVLRSKNHYKYGSSLKLFKNGEDISGNTTTKSKSILEQELSSSLNYDNLTSIIVLGQGLPNRLSTLRPSSRKSRLEELSKSEDIVNDLNNKLSKISDELLRKMNEINSEIIRSSTLLDSSNITISNNANKIEEIKLKAEELISQQEYEIYYKEYLELDKEVSILEAKLYNISTNISDIGYKLAAANTDLTNSRFKNEQFINELKSLKLNKCHACGQDIGNKIDLDNLVSQVSQKIFANKQHMQQLFSNISNFESSTEEEKVRFNSLKDMITTKKERLTLLNRWINDYKSFSSSTQILEEGINKAKEIITLETAKKEELNKKLEELNAEISIHGYLKNQLSRKFRSFLLDGIVDYMNHKSKEYSKYLFQAQGEVNLSIEGNDIRIRLGNRNFEDLSGGEGRKVDIILQLLQRDLAYNELGLSSNLLVLDEILDNLDVVGADAVMNLLAEKSPDIDTMMIISHQRDFNMPNDRLITVIKNKEQISKIYEGMD